MSQLPSDEEMLGGSPELGYLTANRVYEIDDGEQHWVVAETEDEAVDLHWRLNGYSSRDAWERDCDGFTCVELAWNKSLSIRDAEGTDAESLTLLAYEWAKQSEKGLIATTCF